MKMPGDLLKLYAGLPAAQRFYVRARWLVNPVDAIENLVPAEGTVYDIGCGAGILSNIMAMRSDRRNVIGIDLSEEKIALARSTVGARKNVQFRKADALNLVFDKPDTIVACDLLHHIPSSGQEDFLKHIYEALGDGGLLLVQDIDKRPFHKYLFALGVDLILNRMEKVYYLESGRLKDVLERIGFSVEMKRLDKGYPIAAVSFICRKNKKV
ncbi:MAG: class I SAM-dependent methyltransferase [Candidatus Omnitrophica bacterium]|nr:class I SAM-dependent methyltransferase [Candidatus Omnitrophota bacterium]